MTPAETNPDQAASGGPTRGGLPPLAPLLPLVGRADLNSWAAARAAVAASIPRGVWPAAGR